MKQRPRLGKHLAGQRNRRESLICDQPRNVTLFRTLRDQIANNLERAWELTGGSEDQLTDTMLQISGIVAQQFKNQ